MNPRSKLVIGGAVALWVLTMFAMGVAGLVALASFGGGGPDAPDWSERKIQGDGTEKVAVIRVSGVITGGESSGGGLASGSSAGSDDIISQLRQATDDDDVAAVILRLETPGGEVVASDDIYKQIVRTAGEKPVIGLMGAMATSGGYYLAAATNTILANPATITGSIGVIMTLPNFEGTAEKLGVKQTTIKSGAMKDAGSPFKDLAPEEQALFQKLIDESYEQFVTAVDAGRDNLSAEQVRTLADGRVYSGKQAKDNGLIDDFADLRGAYRIALRRAKLEPDEATLVEYRATAGLGDLFSPFGKSPVEEAKRELGVVGFGLKYMYVP
ncbi:MAG TPA: signal peptide peptidase SppA [Actinomycetota bacterium]|nr:signal peptide peptidase SppA [Actinomycetota bacterium]